MCAPAATNLRQRRLPHLESVRLVQDSGWLIPQTRLPLLATFLGVEDRLKRPIWHQGA